jgi:CheY-like chemotaxis protein
MVIVDYLMPVIDGAEFTRRFRRLAGKSKVPVVMVTGFGDEDVREVARSVGVDAFLTKPVDRIQLSACILNLSALRTASNEASLSERHSRDYDAIDTDELVTTLAERDRMRALTRIGDSESHADACALLATTPTPSGPYADIVILDDERTSIAMLDYHVRKLNCVPARFTDAQEALEWCAAHEASAVIVDYMMPDVNGLEFTRRFRSLPGKKDIPVVMISAYADSAVKQAAHDVGVNEFLHKPVDVAQLAAHLRTILAARALHRRLAKHERMRADSGAAGPRTV